ncbi:MAG: hypothetical protein N3G80_01090 [Candidatus Micrarchaeota archaeon]|nr:hypothetical protein [Candidatus Micrarchaeota archaeon]
MSATIKAQAAIELIAYASFFLLLFVATVGIFFQQQAQGLYRAENAYAQEIAFSFADAIYTAFVAGPGFSQRVQLPKDILGKPYNISISFSSAPSQTETGFVYVEWASPLGPGVFAAATVTTSYDALTSGQFIRIFPREEKIFINPSYGSSVCIKHELVAGKSTIKFTPPNSC